MSIGCGRHKILRKIELLRMPALGSQAPRFVERDARVVADIHRLVVNPRRPLAGEIDLCAGRPARSSTTRSEQRS